MLLLRTGVRIEPRVWNLGWTGFLHRRRNGVVSPSHQAHQSAHSAFPRVQTEQRKNPPLKKAHAFFTEYAVATTTWTRHASVCLQHLLSPDIPACAFHAAFAGDARRRLINLHVRIPYVEHAERIASHRNGTFAGFLVPSYMTCYRVCERTSAAIKPRSNHPDKPSGESMYSIGTAHWRNSCRRCEPDLERFGDTWNLVRQREMAADHLFRRCNPARATSATALTSNEDAFSDSGRSRRMPSCAAESRKSRSTS